MQIAGPPRPVLPRSTASVNIILLLRNGLLLLKGLRIEHMWLGNRMEANKMVIALP